jgi:hypothetical protein
MDPVEALSVLGRKVAENQDSLSPTENEHAVLRARLVSSAFVRRGSRVALRSALALAAAAAAAAVAAWTIFSSHGSARAIGFDVGPSPGVPGEFLSASENQPLPIVFTEGSRVTFTAGTKGRIASVSSAGADVVIESGRAEIAVVPRAGNKWSVHTGPFAVNVTGTRFDVAWDGAKDTFSLALFEGKVVVSGCVFGEGQTVVAGDRVEATCHRGEFRVSKIDPKDDDQRIGLPAQDLTDPLQSGAATALRPTAEWLSLARQGRYDEAYSAVESAGFFAECGRIGASDLLLLGDAARLTGHYEAARSAYHAVRSRFARTPSASMAAFYLGRIDLDLRTDLSSAGKWLRTYLDEQPNGSLSAAALGRLLEVQVAQNDEKSARSLATKYLHRFPNGPHAATAERVLSEASSE